jgi:transcriptional regulator with XRE-family HTH domain
MTGGDDMIDKKEIGKLIQESRKNKEMTQQQLAEKTGLSRNYISDVENGRYTPSAETLFRICSILEIDLNNFIQK